MNAEAETKGNVMNVETSAFERETDKNADENRCYEFGPERLRDA